MELFVRVLEARADEFAARLREHVGFTEEEAERFLGQAGPALMRSYEWQAPELAARGLCAPDSVRDLLAGIPGRRLGRTLGISQARTWAGLRLLVPAVVMDLEGQVDAPGVDARVGRRHTRDTVGLSAAFDLGPRARRIERDRDHESRPSWARRGHTLGHHPVLGRLPHLAE